MSPRRIAKALAAFGAVALATLIGVTVYVVRSRSSAPTVSRIAGLVPGTLLHAHNFHWTQMKGGERQWVLTAGDASYSDDKTSLILNDATVEMTSAEGKQVTVDAPRVAIVLNGNHVTRADLTGGTTIHYGDFVVSTAEAIFTPDDDKVEAPGTVTIEGDGLKVRGIGLSGNPKTRQFRLLSHVSTQIVPRRDSAGPTQG